MEQLFTHILGDFVLQSDWMALKKNTKTLNCLVHVIIYTFCFWLFLTHSWPALLVIGGTHFIIDRFPVILKRLIWWRNHFPTLDYPFFESCSTTGYYDDSPYNKYKIGTEEPLDAFHETMYGKPRHFFITIWLYIVHDNFLHLLINYLALKYLT